MRKGWLLPPLALDSLDRWGVSERGPKIRRHPVQVLGRDIPTMLVLEFLALNSGRKSITFGLG
jgi:hypothetical protein